MTNYYCVNNAAHFSSRRSSSLAGGIWLAGRQAGTSASCATASATKKTLLDLQPKDTLGSLEKAGEKTRE